jgi:hypothetical protein
MNPIDYLYMQMRLEGIRLTRENLLALLSGNCDDLPIALFGRASDGQSVSFFSESLSAKFREKLNKSAKKIQFPDIESVTAIFDKAGIPFRVGHFKTYLTSVNIQSTDATMVQSLPKQDPRVVNFGFGGFADDVFAIEEGGAIVSACVSARQNEECAEAWVFTAETHRRRGLARQVVTVWARRMTAKNLIPFYSHVFKNTPSAGLAGKMGLFPVFEEIQIQQDAGAGRTTEHH